MAESAAARARRAKRVLLALETAYPDAACALHFENAFELLIATILSAQCTDAKVNEVTRELFRAHGEPQALASAPAARIEKIVRPTGFYRQKTKSIQSTAQDLCEKFGGRVPGTLDELVTLRGVARKTANLVLGECFDTPGLVVDTHMKRVNQRLGLTAQDDPVKIERDLAALVPQPAWTRYSHQIIHHGRRVCAARKPRCGECPLIRLCPSSQAAA